MMLVRKGQQRVVSRQEGKQVLFRQGYGVMFVIQGGGQQGKHTAQLAEIRLCAVCKHRAAQRQCGIRKSAPGAIQFQPQGFQPLRISVQHREIIAQGQQIPPAVQCSGIHHIGLQLLGFQFRIAVIKPADV